ncbi:MAG: GntR family transcriptional regulator [Phycisphaerae bacterium]|nr:GntR family transcriptional regulator [Phycisphaerae bacterium]
MVMKKVLENLEPGGPPSESPRYLALKADLRDQILRGRIAQGSQIPPEHELCRRYGISRNTVQRAVRDLVREGLVTRHRGRGSFVRFRRSDHQQTLVGVLWPRHSGRPGAYEEVLHGVERAAEEAGFHLTTADTRNDPVRSIELAKHFNESKTVGALFIPTQGLDCDQVNREVIRTLRDAGQQVVLIDTDLDGGESLSSVVSRNFEGSYAVTRHLIGLGYRRIAHLRGPHNSTTEERLAGFAAAVREAGLAIRPEYTLMVAARDVDEQGVQEVDVFKAMAEPPEAVVCIHDLIALNVLRRCAERGIRVPEDLAVVGFDDLHQARVCSPPLTTVRQQLFTMGKRAMEILVQRIRGETPGPVKERLACELVVRRSCGAYINQQVQT